MTVSPPAVLLHDNGTPQIAQSRKKKRSASRYAGPVATKWKSSATSVCLVFALDPARYCDRRPNDDDTLYQFYETDATPKESTVHKLAERSENGL